MVTFTRRRLIVKGHLASVKLWSRAHAFASPALRCPFRKTAGVSWVIGSEATTACFPLRAPNNRGRSAEPPGGTARLGPSGPPSITVAVFRSVIALQLSVARYCRAHGYIWLPPFVRRGSGGEVLEAGAVVVPASMIQAQAEAGY